MNDELGRSKRLVKLHKEKLHDYALPQCYGDYEIKKLYDCVIHTWR